MPSKKQSNKTTAQVKKPASFREAAEKTRAKQAKPRRLKKTAHGAARPIRAGVHFGKKEFYIPLPDNNLGRFLNKRRTLVPNYFRESWQELRQVTWPDRKTTIKLTFAVFVFATIFGILIGLVDYGLEKLFRELIL